MTPLTRMVCSRSPVPMVAVGSVAVAGVGRSPVARCFNHHADGATTNRSNASHHPRFLGAGWPGCGRISGPGRLGEESTVPGRVLGAEALLIWNGLFNSTPASPGL